MPTQYHSFSACRRRRSRQNHAKSIWTAHDKFLRVRRETDRVDMKWSLQRIQSAGVPHSSEESTYRGRLLLLVGWVQNLAGKLNKSALNPKRGYIDSECCLPISFRPSLIDQTDFGGSRQLYAFSRGQSRPSAFLSCNSYPTVRTGRARFVLLGKLGVQLSTSTVLWGHSRPIPRCPRSGLHPARHRRKRPVHRASSISPERSWRRATKEPTCMST